MNNLTFKVKMSCYGCVGAVIKALSDNGINSVDVNFEEQLVHVKTDKKSNYVLDLINATGKKAIMV